MMIDIVNSGDLEWRLLGALMRGTKAMPQDVLLLALNLYFKGNVLVNRFDGVINYLLTVPQWLGFLKDLAVNDDETWEAANYLQEEIAKIDNGQAAAMLASYKESMFAAN